MTALTVGGVVAPARATSAGANGLIAFEWWPDITNETSYIVGVDPVSGQHRRFTIHDTRDPAWSPDGRWFAVEGISAERTGDPRLHALTHDYGIGPAWSPDGSRIAYWAYGVGGDQIFVVDVLTGMVTQLTNDDLAVHVWPAWSPDGHRIAFVGAAPGATDSDIFVMNADGSGVADLTNNPKNDSDPSWSPDGSEIAFDRSGHIHVMNADGTNVHEVGTGVAVNPSWSPDGTQIAYEGAASHVFVMNADGSDPRDVTPFPNELQAGYAPAWQPACTIVGTRGDDVLTGTDGRDVICGGGGNDAISGLGGNDVIFGGSGDDTIDGGPGTDVLVGGPGADRLMGRGGADLLNGIDLAAG
ncbi:MAG TPA: hypothetical protein VEN82_08875, partial [Actinomycetota bacterium]|nr:hypothetical protein [Actinomycetota bacterium]